jgi:cytoskeleton protein RodZ
MNESTQESSVMTGDGTGPVGAGAVLTAAREACGMSIEDAAGALRLGKEQLLALESGDTASLPDPTFVRGFIRNYARLLKINPEPLLQAYQSARHSITLQSENITISKGGNRGWRPYLLSVLLAMAVLAGWAFYMNNTAEMPAQQAPEQHPPTQVEESVGGWEQPPMPEAIQAPVPETADEPSAPQPAETVPAIATETIPAAAIKSTSQLKMVFKDRVWMSVVDGAGKVIYENTGLSGNTELIEGVPPLKLVIGNAAGVQITFNGKAVDLAPHAKDNIARLTLE